MIHTDMSCRENAELDDFVLEELCEDFEARWQVEAGGPQIEVYLERVNEKQRPRLVEELIAIECELLAGHGQMPSRSEYYQRFPLWKDAVDSAFQWWQTAHHVSAPAKKTSLPERLGDYRIVREIGRGGMGIIYEAVQESLNRRVAIKVLAAHPLHQAENVKRFQRETRAVGALHHSNIVEVHGTGEQDGLYYYAMQLVEGQSLSHVIAEQKSRAIPLPPGNVAEIGLQVARALDYAHVHHVLHRDIKPANILLDTDGAPHIADFGLAKLRHEEVDATRTGNVIGTLRYLPPEAIHGQWDERGDVYGLGVTLYELLTLKPAFGERDTTKLLQAITQGEPLQPRSVDPSIPLDLQTVILKAAALEPADRYQTAGEMADDLQRFLDGEPIAARRTSLLDRALKWSRRKPALAALLAVVLLVSLVGFPTLAVLWRQAKTEATKANAARRDAEAVTYARTMSLAQSSIEKLDRTEAEQLLDRKSTNQAAQGRRGWEWKYLSQQLDSSLMSLSGHSGPVLFIAVSPDDSQIATVGGWQPRDKTQQETSEVILWDAKTGERQHVLRDDQSGVTGACYNPDGRRLATVNMPDDRNGGFGSIHIWDPESGNLLHTIELGVNYSTYLLLGEYKPILPGVLFSPDGRWLVSWPNPIEVRRADTYELVWQTPGSIATVLPATLGVVSLGGGEATLRQLATGESVRSLGDWKVPFDFSYSSDGRQLSALLNASNQVRIWDLPELTQYRDIPAPSIRWGAVAPDGAQLVFGDRAGALHFQPLDNSRPTTSLLGHRGPINHGAFTHDGTRVITASEDGTARVWSISGGGWRRTVETGLRNELLGDIAFAEDGDRIFNVSRMKSDKRPGAMGWFDLRRETQGERQLDITHWAQWPRTDFAFSHNGRWLAAPAAETDHVEVAAIGHPRSGRINVWSTATGQIARTLEMDAPEITSIAWSRDDCRLAVAAYDGRSAIEIRALSHWKETLGAGKQATKEKAPLLEGQSVARVTIDDQRITAMSFAPETAQLAASTERGIYLIPRHWEVSAECLEHGESASFLDFDPAGRRLAVAYRQELAVRVFNAIDGGLLWEVDAPRAVSCVRFSPNGRRLAMVGYDSLVYLCDSRKGHRLITLSGAHMQAGTMGLTPRVVFSRDGRRIATNDWQGRITVWRAEPAPQIDD